ncbi:MAG: hypothetical protein PUA81_09350 [Oscillospiraceae bacterium]|nr:hypothetical protein [Oscillospiraceae bacterium]
MKIKKILAVLTSIIISVSATGCMSLKDFLYYGSSETDEESVGDSESEKSGTDGSTEESEKLAAIKSNVESLIEYAKKEDCEDKITELTETLLAQLDELAEEVAYVMVDYYSDFYNEDVEEKYDALYEDYYVAMDYLGYGFANAYNAGNYDDLLEMYTNDDSIDYYTDKNLSLKRLESYARSDYAAMDAALDSYFDLAADEDMDDDEKNLAAAETYLEILSDYEAESFYDSFNRDFNGKDIIAMSDTLIEQMTASEAEIEDVIYSVPGVEKFLDSPMSFDEPIETLREYAGRISPEMGESADKLYDEKLYRLMSGDDCYNGSFCIELPASESAMIYVYCDEDFYSLTTAIHEFGHFHSSFYDDTPDYLCANNIDIAEIQSQGMEMLFMNYYDEIFGDQAEIMKVYKLYEMIDTTISACLIGQFEYDILSHRDDLTPENVVKRFNTLMKQNDYDVQLYEITHIFEQPGYYISYCVSALAALDIWMNSLDDYDRAVEMYNKISRIKSNSSEYQFRSAISMCGFRDVMSDKFFGLLSERVSEYLTKYQ